MWLCHCQLQWYILHSLISHPLKCQILNTRFKAEKKNLGDHNAKFSKLVLFTKWNAVLPTQSRAVQKHLVKTHGPVTSCTWSCWGFQMQFVWTKFSSFETGACYCYPVLLPALLFKSWRKPTLVTFLRPLSVGFGWTVSLGSSGRTTSGRII